MAGGGDAASEGKRGETRELTAALKEVAVRVGERWRRWKKEL